MKAILGPSEKSQAGGARKMGSRKLHETWLFFFFSSSVSHSRPPLLSSTSSFAGCRMHHEFVKHLAFFL